MFTGTVAHVSVHRQRDHVGSNLQNYIIPSTISGIPNRQRMQTLSLNRCMFQRYRVKAFCK